MSCIVLWYVLLGKAKKQTQGGSSFMYLVILIPPLGGCLTMTSPFRSKAGSRVMQSF